VGLLMAKFGSSALVCGVEGISSREFETMTAQPIPRRSIREAKWGNGAEIYDKDIAGC
jgi:hypothetical protein